MNACVHWSYLKHRGLPRRLLLLGYAPSLYRYLRLYDWFITRPKTFANRRVYYAPDTCCDPAKAAAHVLPPSLPVCLGIFATGLTNRWMKSSFIQSTKLKPLNLVHVTLLFLLIALSSYTTSCVISLYRLCWSLCRDVLHAVSYHSAVTTDYSATVSLYRLCWSHYRDMLHRVNTLPLQSSC